MKISRPIRGALAAAGLSLLAGSGLAGERDLAGLVEPYLRARDERLLGIVAVRAYAEPARPSAGPAPLPSVSMVVLPYSAAFEAELDAVKAGLRDSLDAFVQAVARIEGARVDYESGLLAAGGGDLVRSGITDAQGGVQLGDMPVGEWLILAWQEGGHTSKRFKLRDLDAKRYPNVPTNVTYSVVTYWRARLTIRPGETAAIAATDRNVWMTAGRQEGGTPVPPRRPPTTGTDKRR